MHVQGQVGSQVDLWRAGEAEDQRHNVGSSC